MVTPPKFLESLVTLLLPPAVREQVLGDIHERYESPVKYIVDAASVVPAAIFGQLRRAMPIPFRLLEVLIVYSSVFVGGRLLSVLDVPPPSPSQVAHLTMVALAGLVWHDLYYVRPSESELITEFKLDFPWLKRILQRPFGDVCGAITVPYLVLNSIGSLLPSVRAFLNPPHGFNVLGLFIASSLISLLRKRIGKRHPSVGA
jgi:hypothetical protein